MAMGGGPPRQRPLDVEEMPLTTKTSREEDSQMESMLSEEGNREVREKCLDLLDQVKEYSGEGNESDPHRLQILLLQANDVFETVKRPREAAIDSEVLKACGELIKTQIESTSTSIVAFRPTDFADRLTSWLLQENEEDTVAEESDEEETPNLLARLGRRTRYLKRSVPGVEPFFSAVEWEGPKSKRRTRTRRDAETFAKQKTVIEAVQKKDEPKETQSMSWKLKILKELYAQNNNKAICFYSFFLDPFSFSRTIENLFHISLLAHDSHVEIFTGEDGLPMIKPRIAGDGSQGLGDHDNQSVICMDADEWEELIKAFEITVPMIPPIGGSPRKSSKKETPMEKTPKRKTTEVKVITGKLATMKVTKKNSSKKRK